MKGGMLLMTHTDSKVSWHTAPARVGGAAIVGQEIGLGKECQTKECRTKECRTGKPKLRGCLPLQIPIPARVCTPRLVLPFERATHQPALSRSPPRSHLQRT
jgi:hypothetical protein